MDNAGHKVEVERIRAEHDGWVPVELLLPLMAGSSSLSDWLNISCENDFVCAGLYSKALGWQPRQAVAWQPLPEPYQP